MLSKIVDAIDNLNMDDKDAKGDLYEYLLSKVATAGTNGQFRTPRHIIKMMAELIDETNTRGYYSRSSYGHSWFLSWSRRIFKRKS